MSDATQLSTRLPSQVPIGREGYQAGREVKARASVLRDPDTAENRTAITRLDRFLSQEKPLRDDVPRGFHLNILV